MTPQRIQRKRAKGWKLPANTISVTRPGKWGNPFKVGEYVKLGDGSPGFMFLKCNGAKYANDKYIFIDTVEKCIEVYEEYLKRYPPKDIEELRGKNLACFCKEDKPCHADVLLKIANS